MSATSSSAKRNIIGALVGISLAAGLLLGIRHYQTLNDNRTHRGEEWNNGDFYFGNDLLCLDLSDPRPAYRFNATVIPRPLPSDRAATLFYQRRDAGIGFRLLLIEALPRDGAGNAGREVDIGTTIASGPGKTWSSRSTLSLARDAKLYHAQPDPADASHFTIRFDAPAVPESGVIDGWLTKDNAVRFERREPSPR